METLPGSRGLRVVAAARRGIILSLVVSAWALTGMAHGQTFEEFPIPTEGASPYGIVAGPDGNLWFTENSANKIGRITTSGEVTEFPVSGSSFPRSIAAGSDGALWFTESGGRIGRITTGGDIEHFRVATPNAALYAITAGPDGNLWFTEYNADKVGKITTHGEITEFALPRAIPNGETDRKPRGIVAGPDGNLWFTESFLFANRIGKISPSGVIQEFPVPTTGCPNTDFLGTQQPDCGLSEITRGPDGNLWFLETRSNNVSRITPSGVVTKFPIPTYFSEPAGITAGPDGNLWFTESATNKIGRVTTSGVITEFVVPTDSSKPTGITTGPDGYLWFTEDSGNKIGRMTASTTGPCHADSSTLCLRDNRFKVQLAWSNPNQGRSGTGTAIPLTEDTGYFWFFNSANVELVIKALDGRNVNGHYWIFYGALSNVQYTITVTDTVTGNVKIYENPAGTLASFADTSAFAAAHAVGTVPETSPGELEARSTEELYALLAEMTETASASKALAEACTPGGTTLCLNQSRFQVTLDWEIPSKGRSGHGMATPITGDTGYFWFFNEDNVELVIKVLDGRTSNGHFWVFYGALSSVQYTITITDTETGAVKTYTNPSGTLASVADTNAF